MINDLSSAPRLKFFGRELDLGVLGMIHPQRDEIIFFSTPSEMRQGAPPSRLYKLGHEPWRITDICFTSGPSVLVSLTAKGAPGQAGGRIIQMPSLDKFRECLESRDRNVNSSIEMPLYNCVRLHFDPDRWCTNATTFTALDPNGKVRDELQKAAQKHLRLNEPLLKVNSHHIGLDLFGRPALPKMSRPAIRKQNQPTCR
jgi:hypothetical protein